MATKRIQGRHYRVEWTTPACGFLRVLTLRAKSKKQATKLVADRYHAKSHKTECLK